MKLFEPGNIGKLSLKNRIVMAAMGVGGHTEPDGRLAQRAIDYYACRARGGVGLIITGAFNVRRSGGPAANSLGTTLVIDSNISIGRLSELADTVHDYSTKIVLQLTVGMGRIAGAETQRKGEAIAPSSVPCFFAPNALSRELSTEEVARMIEAFTHAAELVSAAGIDGIEINCHNGYLADEFMTPLWNKRTDKYGGDLEGRLRFLMEIISSVRKAVGPAFPIIVKYGLTHYLDGGRQIEEGLEIARRLEAVGVHALDIDAGCYETSYFAKPTTYSPPGSLADLAGMVKKVVSIPVIAVGKMGYPDLAENILQEGKADFIGLGRALLADADWPNKVKAGELDQICPCIGEYEGCSVRIAKHQYISCTVNPACGMEREFEIRPAGEKKSVLVVGGGPAGMEAARVAALRGHRVTLLEKADALGGNLIPACKPDFKADYRSLIDYQILQTNQAGVEVRLSTEGTPQLVQRLKPDVVFIATGATPIVPDIPGLDKKNALTAVDVLMGAKTVGRRVVIIGGGVVGCETGLFLTRQGKELTVVEREEVARGMYLSNRQHILKLLADANVKILSDTDINEITDKGIVIADRKSGDRRKLEADTLIFAVGLKANAWLAEALQGKAPEVYAIGDCVEPRKVINAIWEGFRKARLV